MIDKCSDNRDYNIAQHVISMRTLAEKSNNYDNFFYDLRDQLFTKERNEDYLKEIEEMDQEKKFFTRNKMTSISLNWQKHLFKPAFLAKFISYVKNRPIEPTFITSTAQDRIISFYTEIRLSYHNEIGLPITARTLETLIRLATANAKLCLDNNEITEYDVIVAEMVLRGAILGIDWENMSELVKRKNQTSSYQYKDFSQNVPLLHEKSDKSFNRDEKFLDKIIKPSVKKKIESKKGNSKFNRSETETNEEHNSYSIEVVSSLKHSLNILSDRKHGIINFMELRKIVEKSDLQINEAQLRNFLKQQGDRDMFFVIS
jgi:DNA replicative helicase MCM subunit Mcm2 (Cdc46/Mcm family)